MIADFVNFTIERTTEMFSDEQLNAVPATKQFYTVPCICQTLQILPHQAIALAAEAGVDPDHFVDGRPVYRGDGLARMLDVFNAACKAAADRRAKALKAASN